MAKLVVCIKSKSEIPNYSNPELHNNILNQTSPTENYNLQKLFQMVSDVTVTKKKAYLETPKLLHKSKILVNFN